MGIGRFARATRTAAGFAVLSLLAMAAHAVQPTALTVPWVASNPLIPHDTFTGVPHTLKGTADVQGANFQYIWDFGDGSAPAVGTVTNRYVIPASHAYVGPVGSIFVATLTVRDTNTGEFDTANYLVAIRDLTLETEVNAAIDDGLWYLHQTMTRTAESGTNIPYGYWGTFPTGSGYVSTWASNVQAFEVNGHLESGSPSNPYTETVRRGIAGVLSGLNTAVLPPTQTNALGTFNPDHNGNGYGVFVAQGIALYQGGMIMDMLVASGTPAATAALGPPPAGANPGIRGRTYQSIVQDYVDYYAYCQYDFDGGGGWRYNCQDFPDGSANQWAAIGIIAATRSFGATVNPLVLNWNRVWIDYAHDAATGGSGYTQAAYYPWGPYALTPSGTVQMAMTGIGRGNALWDTSETFLRNNFCNATNSPYTSIRDYYYGLFSFTKSMLLHDANGDNVAEPLTLLAQQPSGANPLDWYEAEVSQGAPCNGVARQLVDDQNAAGYWYGNDVEGTQMLFDTGWAIIMLNRTVFASGVPVAVASANPNPGVAGASIGLDGSGSFHQDAAKTITTWRWDLDNDGAFDDAAGVSAATSFPAIGDYPVGLEVCDDSNPQECDDTTIVVRITLPPLAPTADAGGPYGFCPAQQWFLDGTGSTNPDNGLSEPGLPGDFITSFAWDLDNDGLFDDAAGSQPNVTAFYTPGGAGSFLARLRVMDNTASSFPSSGMGNLSSVDSAEVTVRSATDPACACIADLTARPKNGKVQLVWGNTSPAGGYNVYRSTVSGGPYSFLANTTSTYSTYLDGAATNGTTYYYVVRPAALNGAELCQSNQAQATPSARLRP